MRQASLFKFLRNLAGAIFLVGLSLVAVTLYAARDSKVALSDLQWMEQAARAGAAEVQGGRLAAQQAKLEEVRKLGERVADHHARAGGQLMALARERGVHLPDTPDHAHQRRLAQLAGTPGERFDEEYIRRSAAADHQEAAQLYEEGIDHLKDPALREYALNTLPMIRRDYQAMRDLKQVL